MLTKEQVQRGLPRSLRVIIYCRVSTDDQEDNTSLEQQEIDAREYCELHGLTVTDVVREVYTGAVWRERKEYMEKVRKLYLEGKADGVVVRTYSRLTRIVAHYFVLTQEMKEHNVRLFCVKEQYDDTPLGRTLQAIQMGFNETERETIRQRTMDGKRARVTNKKLYLAGKKPPYGLRFDDQKTKGKLVEHEVEAETVRTILCMRAQKATIYTIVKYLNDNHIPSPNNRSRWNGRTVRMIIDRANDLYVGVAYAYKYEFTKEYRGGKLVTAKRKRPLEEQLLLPEGTVPRLIDDETARRALAAADINAKDASRNNPNPERSLLRAGYIKCGICGRAMSVHTKHTKKYGTYLYYRCNSLDRTDPSNHEYTEISLPKIDKIVWDYVYNVVKHLEIIETAVNKAMDTDVFTSPEKATIKAIQDCTVLVEQYREDLKMPGLSRNARAVLVEDLGKQTDLLEDLERELTAIRLGKASHEKVLREYQEFVAWCQRFKADGQAASDYTQRRNALRFLGVTVYIYKEGSDEGRHKIRLAPPDLMRSLKIVPRYTSIAGALSGLGPRNIEFLLEYSDRYGLRYCH